MEGLGGSGRIWEDPVGSWRVLEGPEGLGGSSRFLEGQVVSPQLYQLPENQGPEHCLKGSKMAKFPPFNQVLQRVFLTFFCKNGHNGGKMERVNSYIGG